MDAKREQAREGSVGWCGGSQVRGSRLWGLHGWWWSQSTPSTAPVSHSPFICLWAVAPLRPTGWPASWGQVVAAVIPSGFTQALAEHIHQSRSPLSLEELRTEGWVEAQRDTGDAGGACQGSSKVLEAG